MGVNTAKVRQYEKANYFLRLFALLMHFFDGKPVFCPKIQQ